jgi:lysyl-tRNA synthetase, class II
MATAITSTALRKRADLLRRLRHALDARGFIEVTTPVMLKVASGGPAASHPFEYEGGRYDLRTSIELLLRTALQSESRVYDIGSAIRLQDRINGSRSAAEFTLMECFAAHLDYDGLLHLAVDLIMEVKPSLPKPTRISVVDWFAEEFSINFDSGDSEGVRKSLLRMVGAVDVQQPLFKLINDAVSTHLEPKLKGFVILTGYPIETICLANRDPGALYVAQRFEVFFNGIEIGHGFVDSADPEDVLKRMTENGAEYVDSDFVAQMRSGALPASAGFGLGIERLLACDDDTLDVHQYLHEYQHA